MFIKFFQLLYWFFLDGRKKSALKYIEHRAEKETRFKTWILIDNYIKSS